MKLFNQWYSLIKSSFIQYWLIAIGLTIFLSWILSYLPDSKPQDSVMYQYQDEIYELENELISEMEMVEKYKRALLDANTTIDELNDEIHEAKTYQWETYDEMGDALESLEEKDNVDIRYY